MNRVVLFLTVALCAQQFTAGAQNNVNSPMAISLDQDASALVVSESPATPEPLLVPNGFAPEPNTWYRLKNLYLGDNVCLDANQRYSKVHGGGIYMAPEKSSTAQLWRFVKTQDGYYRLQSAYWGSLYFLEGGDGTLPAFMDRAQNVSGQYWTLTPDGSSFRLQNEFRGPGEDIEGNNPEWKNDHSGGAYMTKKGNYSGQLWILEPVTNAESIIHPGAEY